MRSQYLSKNFLRYLLASVLIKILEKALAVKTILFYNLLESKNNVVNDGTLFFACLSATVVSVGASIVNYSIKLLFQTFLCEHLINMITELSPFDVLSFFWCLKVSSQKIKLSRANNNLSHTECNSKLGVGYETRSQFIKVPKELVNSNSPLFADSTNSSNYIV